MPAKPPLPLVQAFVVCRELYHSPRTGDLILFAPFSSLTGPRYPAKVPLSVYAHLMDARGRYAIALRLLDAADEVVWEWELPQPIEESDPLAPHRIILPEVPVLFPKAGRYDLVIAVNGTTWSTMPSGPACGTGHRPDAFLK